MTCNHHFQYYGMTYPPNQSVSAFTNNCQLPNTNPFISNFQPSVPDIQSFTNNPQPPVPSPFIDNLQPPVPGSESSNNQLTPNPTTTNNQPPILDKSVPFSEQHINISVNSNKQPAAHSQLPDTNNNAITTATVQPTHLKDPHVVLQNNPKLCTKGNIGRLAVKLARESFFGEVHSSWT